MRPLSECGILQGDFNAIRQIISLHEVVLRVYKTQAVNPRKCVVDDFVVVRSGDGNALSLNRIRDRVGPDDVVPRTSIPSLRGLYDVSNKKKNERGGDSKTPSHSIKELVSTHLATPDTNC